MSYPPQPGGYQPMPQHTGQIDPEIRPSGGTAITAGVLGIIGGLVGLIQLIRILSVLGQVPSAATGFLVIALVIFLVWTATLIAGPIMLFMRKPLGPLLTAIGSGLAVACFILLAILLGAGAGFISEATGVTASGAAGIVVGIILVAAAPAIATFVLSIVPATRRYVNWQPGQGAMYQQQQPPYPPQGQGQQPPFPPAGGQQQPW